MAMSAKASDDIAWLPATAQLAVLAAKKVSSAELVELYLSRIDTYNASLNAIVTVDPTPPDASPSGPMRHEPAATNSAVAWVADHRQGQL